MQAGGIDRATLERLYRDELPSVYAFLRRQGAREHDLKDLAHDVFITAARRWSTYDASRAVRPWLLGIAFRLWADHRRRKRNSEVTGADVPDRSTDATDLETGIRAREAQDLVGRALASLDPDRRAALIMYELEGIAVRDIAAAMEVPLPTVYSRLRTGRTEFAAAVRRVQLQRGDR